MSVVTLARALLEEGEAMLLLELSLSRNFTTKEKEVRPRTGGVGRLRGSLPF